ncbi:MAG: hypothetical protein ACE5F7_10080 [Nitrospiria bacterium]
MHDFEPYIKRSIKFIGQENPKGWRIKIYGISQASAPLPEDLVSEGIKRVLPHLPQPALTAQRYGLGFLIIHQGTMRNWFLLDWWEKNDILHHRLFSSSLDDPGATTAEKDQSLIACVHELRVINFEREAWIKTVLCMDGIPRFERYLKLRMGSNA